MKLCEVVSTKLMAQRLDVLNKNKPKSTRTLIKLLRKRADRRNRKTPDTDQNSIYANHDGMVGYQGPTFKAFIDQGIWR